MTREPDASERRFASFPEPYRTLIERWAKSEAILELIHSVLDKRDRSGRLPKRYTLRPSKRSLESLEHFLPPAALKARDDGRVIVELDRIQVLLDREAADRGTGSLDLEQVFDAIASRRPRDLRVEAEEATRVVLAAFREGVDEGRKRAALRGVAAEEAGVDKLAELLVTQNSPEHRTFLHLARSSGLDEAREAIARLIAGLLLARERRRRGEPLRLDLLSIAVAGDTKALRPENPDHGRLADALLALDPELDAKLSQDGLGSRAILRRLVLEHHGIATNDTPLEVLVKGPLELELDGERLRDIATISAKGLSSKLSCALLRRAQPRLPTGARVFSVENESAFCLLAERSPDDLFIFTSGQPSFAVTLLLEKIAQASPATAIYHTGDLDRSGLLILRALRRRTRLEIRPLCMDAETLQSALDIALPMDESEIALTEKLRHEWIEPWGRDLLDALIESRRWLEHEAIIDRCLRSGTWERLIPPR